MSKYRSNTVEDFAEIFKALSNSHRLTIYRRLSSCCAPGSGCGSEADMRRCVGDLGRDLGIAPSTLSHHIKELRRVGLIRVERRGQRMECWIDPDVLDALTGFLSRSAVD